jgi:hypothetical protein
MVKGRFPTAFFYLRNPSGFEVLDKATTFGATDYADKGRISRIKNFLLPLTHREIRFQSV